MGKALSGLYGWDGIQARAQGTCVNPDGTESGARSSEAKGAQSEGLWLRVGRSHALCGRPLLPHRACAHSICIILFVDEGSGGDEAAELTLGPAWTGARVQACAGRVPALSTMASSACVAFQCHFCLGAWPGRHSCAQRGCWRGENAQREEKAS